MLKEHLPRVIHHQVYKYTKIYFEKGFNLSRVFAGMPDFHGTGMTLSFWYLLLLLLYVYQFYVLAKQLRALKP